VVAGAIPFAKRAGAAEAWSARQNQGDDDDFRPPEVAVRSLAELAGR